MRKKIELTLTFIIFLASLIIILMYYFKLKNTSTEKFENSNKILNSDSVGHKNFIIEYLQELVNIGYYENGVNHNYENILTYTINDENKTNPTPLSKYLKKAKNNLIVRYTELGCNSCADSTFIYLKKYQELTRYYNIIVLVDFSNYQAFLKWRKVSEIPYLLLWVKKGSFPFKIEAIDKSYIFTLNHSLSTDNFFIPNSRLPLYIDNYFYSINNKFTTKK